MSKIETQWQSSTARPGSLQPDGSADSSPNSALRLARIVLQSPLYSECQEARELTDQLLASGGHSVNWEKEWRSPPNDPSSPTPGKKRHELD